MNGYLASSVTVLADLVDPTDSGVLTSIANYVIPGLMVLAVVVGAYHGFTDWAGKSGEDATKTLRDHAIGVIAIEAFLGGILLIANEGTGIIPGMG